MGDITFNPETGLYERKAGGEERPRGEHDRGQESNSSAGTRGEEQEKERVTGLRMEEQEKERVTRLRMEEQEKEEVTRLRIEEQEKERVQPSEKRSRVEKVKKDSARSMKSSDGELELHPHEEFETPNPKKLVHKVTTAGQESTRPTMKVAARKRSPILATANGTKKVAGVKPVVSTAAPAKQLAGSYAARLTAIKAAKAAEAASKQAAAPAAKKSTVETEPAPSAKSNVTTKSDTALKTALVRAKITGPSLVAPKPVPKQLSAPAKASVVSKDSPTVNKVKHTFTPIGAGGGGEHNLWRGCLFDSHCHLNLVLR